MIEKDLQVLKRFRGDTVPNVVKFKLPNGMPRNLAGYSNFVLTVSKDRSPATTALQVLRMPGQIINPRAGVVAFKPTIDEANRLTPGDYYFDIQATDANGDVVTLGEIGRYTIIQDIGK